MLIRNYIDLEVHVFGISPDYFEILHLGSNILFLCFVSLCRYRLFLEDGNGDMKFNDIYT